MEVNYVAFAIPFFFALIGAELVVAWRRRRSVYRFADTLADLGCGMAQQVVLLLLGGLMLVGYVLLYQHARLIDLAPHPAAAWLVAMVGADVAYYWWHRASHRVNFLWAAHVVHHQSEDYNLAVALRQSVLTPLTSMPFAWPLALLGVPPLIYAGASAFNTLYQFWIHTRLIGRLGPLEAVLNTPSHHRAHHGRDPQYLDCNYGAISIVWDRLFGTFRPEREPPTYGITRPLRSFNPLWAQVEPIADLARQSATAPTWRQRLAVWLAPPERHFSWYPTPPPPPLGAPPHDVPVGGTMRLYLLLQVALSVAATFALMMWGTRLPWPALAAGVALVLVTLACIAGLLERRAWARPLETARVVVVVVLAGFALRG